MKTVDCATTHSSRFFFFLMPDAGALLLFSSPFSAYFTELHSRSERALQQALSPLGPLYSQNTRLFGALYSDLRQYYRGSAFNLDETLSDFWSRLLERIFKSSAPADVSGRAQWAQLKGK